MKNRGLKNVRYLHIVVFVYHEGLYRLDFVDLVYLRGEKIKEGEIFLEHNDQHHVVPAGNDTCGNHPPKFTELFRLFYEFPGVEFYTHVQDVVVRQQIGIDGTNNFDKTCFDHPVESGPDGILGNVEFFGNLVEGFSPILKVFNDGEVYFVDFHKTILNRGPWGVKFYRFCYNPCVYDCSLSPGHQRRG